MKKILLVITIMQLSLAYSCNPGEFTIKKAKQGNEETQLALIDNSSFSQKWLNKNANYLIANKIPVLVKNIERNELLAMNKKYQGLLAGQVPKPTKMLSVLCKQVGIDNYPAVVEKGIIWQVNPHQER